MCVDLESSAHFRIWRESFKSRFWDSRAFVWAARLKRWVRAD
ncbi:MULTISPECIES: hypothetical protein [unclassified Helicobacter]|nr:MULTISPECIES: hypothetical protein [unclassified Helicobacter]